jgi:hypothetical protein
MSAGESSNQGSHTPKDTPVTPLGRAENERGNQKETTAKTDQETENKETNSAKPSRFQRFMHKHFPEARAHDRWTLVFTSVIAISTFFYTVFAGWTLYEIHSGSADTHTLAVAAYTQAALEKTRFGASLDLNKWTGLYHSQDNRSIWGKLQVQNNGPVPAQNLQLAIRLEFRDLDPKPEEYSALRDFQPMGIEQLNTWVDDKKGPFAYAEFEMRQPFREARKIYVWGVVKYKHVVDDNVRFCRQAAAKDVLASVYSDKTSNGGYGGPYIPCTP